MSRPFRALTPWRLLPLLLAPAWVGVGCTAGPEPAARVDTTVAVQCGCVIESVGHCSEYAWIDGQPVELIFDQGVPSLGSMPFCGREGLHAAIRGQRTGDQIVLESFAYAP
jgi:hypothetical protein